MRLSFLPHGLGMRLQEKVSCYGSDLVT